MDRDTADLTTQQRTESSDELPNQLTIVGRGVPSNFEVTVDGDIRRTVDRGAGAHGVVSGATAEGAIDVGVTRFQFSGRMTNVRLVDWNGVAAPASASTPTVHVEYGREE